MRVNGGIVVYHKGMEFIFIDELVLVLTWFVRVKKM
jgi:hypothetical protein